MSEQPQRKRRAKGMAALDDLLSTTESLLVERGYHGISMRDIAQAAGVNLGSVYYYSQSKEDLIRLAIERRIAPINAERVRRFREIEADPPASVSEALRAVLRAFVEPALTVAGAESEEDATRTRAVHTRIHRDAAPEIVKMVYELYGEAGAMLLGLARRFTPHLTDEAFHWRIMCVLGTARFATVGEPWVVAMSHGLFAGEDAQEGTRELVTMLHAGLMAPVSD